MKIKEILKQMTLQEKIRLCAGKSFWETVGYPQYDIPSFFMCDGPSGLRKQEGLGASDMLGINNSRKSTCFPAAVTTADSWDRELLCRIGQAIGEEALDQEVGVVLGPGVNIKRNPLCGRNFEYFSEDPILAGNMAAHFIMGLQSNGVGCSLKHFACNSQEKSRFNSDGIIDERTLREIYLKAFEIAVKAAQPATIMSSYPKINGVHCSDDHRLLTEILRDEWGFKGLVMTDWGGMNDRIKAFHAGNDLMMPGGSTFMEQDVIDAVEKGELSEDDIDTCCERVIELAIKAAALLKKRYLADYPRHHQLTVEAAEKGAVLLKNDGGLLPLEEQQRILIVGRMAEEVRYQGAGSSHINPVNLEQPMDYLGEYIYAPGCDTMGDTSDELLADVAAKAADAEAVVVFAGLPDNYESEGFDRDNMKMPEGHVRMIEAAVKANPNTVVVLLCGSAVECDWADEVRSILYMGLAGEGVGRAIHDLLFGQAAPSGKLAESWPLHYSDVISAPFYGTNRDAQYMEGIYVGYRYYDKAGIDVRWPFGHGLSYTTFELSDCRIKDQTVTATITNTGTREGGLAVQLYVGQNKPALHRPVRELKNFEKVYLQPGESREITFQLKDEDFMSWNDGFRKIKGTYHIELGFSSRDIVFAKDIQIDGEEPRVADWQKGSWYETCKGELNQSQWEAMLGRKYQAPKAVKGQFTMENTVEEMKEHSLIMKIMYKATERTIAKGFGGKADYNNPEFRMMMASSAGAPIRSMVISAGMKDSLFKGMVEMANGHFFKGLGMMIKG